MEKLLVLLIVVLCVVVLFKKIYNQLKIGKCSCVCGCDNNCKSCSKSNNCITLLMRKDKNKK